MGPPRAGRSRVSERASRSKASREVVGRPVFLQVDLYKRCMRFNGSNDVQQESLCYFLLHI